MADRYTREELELFLESDELPPSPLTRKLINKAIRQLYIDAAEAAVNAAVAENDAEKHGRP